MLTLRKRTFADLYKINRNATKSAKLAGYSEKTAHSQGARLLKDVDIKHAISEWENELITREREHINQLTQPKYCFEIWNRYEISEKPDIQFKYIELYGKVRGFLGRESEGSNNNFFQVFMNELNIGDENKNRLQKFDDALKVLTTSTTSVVSEASVASPATDTTPSPATDNTAIDTPTQGQAIGAACADDEHEKNSHSPAQVSEGPEGGVIESVNPLHKSPTILNSVKTNKKSVINKKKPSILEQEVMSFKPTTACEDNELSDN